MQIDEYSVVRFLCRQVGCMRDIVRNVIVKPIGRLIDEKDDGQDDDALWDSLFMTPAATDGAKNPA